MLVPLPGPWVWTLCIFTGKFVHGHMPLAEGAGSEECPHTSVPPFLQAQWAAVSPGTGLGRCGSRSTGALFPVLHT